MKDAPEALIAEALLANYGLRAAEITDGAGGLDFFARVYRVEVPGREPLFVKLRNGPVNPASLIVPHYLRERGMARIIAPVATMSGALSVASGDFSLIVYPFIEGMTAQAHGLDERCWVQWGKTLRKVHDTPVTPEVRQHLAVETFVPRWRDVMLRVMQEIGTREYKGVLAESIFATFWYARREQIAELVRVATELGERLRAANPPQVICHTDIHPWNMLVDAARDVWFVDWDDTRMAPRECDLMYAIGGIGGYVSGKREEAWFRAGYGDIVVDPLALAYYRYAHFVADTGSFAETILYSEESQDVKLEAVRLVMSQFNPGAKVHLAYEAGRAVGVA
jgi:spectinomycin phosphotransferase